MDYELLLKKSDSLGLTVKEKPLKYNNGRIKGNRIAIRKDIKTSTEKACVLAEELGHYYTSVGDILDQSNANNRKQELRARLWAYRSTFDLSDIISAYKAGCRNRFELAEHLNVTEEFLHAALESYKQQYGLYTECESYIVYFDPLAVLEVYKQIEE